jgi:hypothetical protein
MVEVYREQVEPDGRAALKIAEQCEQSVTVLAPAQADHHPVAVFYHVEVAEGAADAA